MSKTFNVFRVMLLILIAMIAAMVATLFLTSHNSDGSLQEGIQTVVMIVFGGIPMIIFAILCFVFLVIDICLWAVKNKKASLVAALVFLCILAPVLGFYVAISVLTIKKPIYLAVVLVTLALYVICFVLACILIHRERKNPAASSTLQAEN